MKIKTKINKWNIIKLKSFCTAKETISKMKRQRIEREKIFSNEVIDKQLLQLNIKKTKEKTNKKMGRSK